MTEHVSLLFAGEPKCKVSQIGFTAWSLSKLADFDRQTFTREMLASWVQEVGASTLYPFTDATTLAQAHTTPKPLQRQRAQELAILGAIQQAECDPLRLPKNQPGKPGIKSRVRDALKRDPVFTGATVFNKAWERMRRNGDIADA